MKRRHPTRGGGSPLRKTGVNLAASFDEFSAPASPAVKKKGPKIAPKPRKKGPKTAPKPKLASMPKPATGDTPEPVIGAPLPSKRKGPPTKPKPAPKATAKVEKADLPSTPIPTSANSLVPYTADEEIIELGNPVQISDEARELYEALLMKRMLGSLGDSLFDSADGEDSPQTVCAQAIDLMRLTSLSFSDKEPNIFHIQKIMDRAESEEELSSFEKKTSINYAHMISAMMDAQERAGYLDDQMIKG
ncbi:hypothetical protein OAN21_01975 [Alphaproteobacteria bacterium]|nr:hypothetical protein [Alphaproteobacteria bacterium]